MILFFQVALLIVLISLFTCAYNVALDPTRTVIDPVDYDYSPKTSIAKEQS